MEIREAVTPKKITETISPLVCLKYCAVCQKDVSTFKVPKDNTVNLWGKDGRKTAACENIESYLNINLNDRDYRVLCKGCHRSIQSALKSRMEKEKSFFEGRKEIEQKYLRKSVKRGVPTDVVPSPESKKAFSRDESKGRRKLDLAANDTIPLQPFFNESNESFMPPVVTSQMIVSIISYSFSFAFAYQRVFVHNIWRLSFGTCKGMNAGGNKISLSYLIF